MIEFVGLVKVNIVKGTDLAVRDVMSSDPYVLIHLGHQVSTFLLRFNFAKTHVFLFWDFRLTQSYFPVHENKGDKEHTESYLE
jgi:hypothetical protein